MTLLLARALATRIVRARRGWLPLAGWCAALLAFALAARGEGDVNGADHVLEGPFAVAVLPLIAYGIVGATLAGTDLRSSIRSVVALGAPPARAALASVALAVVASALVSGVAAAAACGVAHGAADPPLGRDVVATFGIAFVGAAAYAAFFCAGSAVGGGLVRGGLLALDWILGGAHGFGALFTPRAHVASLLGGASCFDLSRRASSVALALLLCTYVAIALRIARRPS